MKIEKDYVSLIGTLIKHNNNLVLVNEDEIKKYDWYFLNQVSSKFGSPTGVYQASNNHKINKINTLSANIKKVIAQSPIIKLSKEISDIVGWIDVEKLAELEYPTKFSMENLPSESLYNELLVSNTGFIKGFFECQSIDNRFTLQEINGAMAELIKISNGKREGNPTFKDLLNEQKCKIKQFKVEYEIKDDIYHVIKIISNE